jgi:ankyrin repeat protein
MPLAKDAIEVLQIRKLLHCVRIEDYAQIKKLCEKGICNLINYNEPQDGQAALMLAAAMNNEKMLEYLLELGAHPNVVDLKVS